MPTPRKVPSDIWKRIRVGAPDECWPFTGAPNTYGYGQMHINGRSVLVHRVAYELATGVAPGALFVCHRCDNPICCNPGHLFLGTVADNAHDAVAKGRHPHGEKHASAKLTEAAVREIRRLFSVGHSFVWIASRYGVTPENVSYICRRITWRHV